MKSHFNKTEAAILRVLFQQKVPLTIYEISKDTDFSYQTIKKYIMKLEKEGFIIKKKGGFINAKKSKKRKS